MQERYQIKKKIILKINNINPPLPKKKKDAVFKR